MPRVYVVTEPARIRGIYASWPECEAVVKGVPGARYQAVSSREHAEAILRGEGRSLAPGLYGFVDGNHLGGIGVVLVEQSGDGKPVVVEQLGTTVFEAFLGSGIRSLHSRPSIREALDRLRNVLAELGALHLLLRLVPDGAAVMVVHDYEGIGAWMERRWRAKDPVVAEIVDACRSLVRDRRLTVSFRHQRAHQSTWAAPDDLAHFNARADALARDAAHGL